MDLQGLRAFVATAEEMHFGRAAERMYLSQQALSKRVRRLEEALGAPLFERTTRKVELTPAGRRLLPKARDALSAFDAAIDSVRDGGGRLRVDVYDERFSPLSVLRELLDRDPGLRIEPSMRQGLAVALPAVQGREIDAAFGQVHDLASPLPLELVHRLSHVRPMCAFVGEDHPLAGREAIRPADLREAGIVMPDPGDAAEARGFLTGLAGHFGIPIRFTEPAVGLLHYGEIVRRERRAVALGEESIELPRGSGLRRVRLVDPVPLAPWSVVWHRQNRNAQLLLMLRLLGEPELPPRDDPGHWLPEAYRPA